MIESLPESISITFILTTFLTVGFLFYAIKISVFETVPAKIFVFLLSFWVFFQAILAISGFYQDTTSLPRVFVFGAFPPILLTVVYFLFFRKLFIEPLPLKILTLLSVIRIPVEIVLLWLFQNQMVPQSMTFEGRNFDILSGITAPIIYYFAFRGGKINRPLLIVWNVLALILLFNIVVTAILAFPSFTPQLAPELQNRAVTLFPFVWLPTVIVPIVLFSHLAALWKLFKQTAK